MSCFGVGVACFLQSVHAFQAEGSVHQNLRVAVGRRDAFVERKRHGVVLELEDIVRPSLQSCAVFCPRFQCFAVGEKEVQFERIGERVSVDEDLAETIETLDIGAQFFFQRFFFFFGNGHVAHLKSFADFL